MRLNVLLDAGVGYTDLALTFSYQFQIVRTHYTSTGSEINSAIPRSRISYVNSTSHMIADVIVTTWLPHGGSALDRPVAGHLVAVR